MGRWAQRKRRGGGGMAAAAGPAQLLVLAVTNGGFATGDFWVTFNRAVDVADWPGNTCIDVDQDTSFDTSTQISATVIKYHSVSLVGLNTTGDTCWITNEFPNFTDPNVAIVDSSPP